MWFWIGLGGLAVLGIGYLIGRWRGEVFGYGKGYLDGKLDWRGQETPDAA